MMADIIEINRCGWLILEFNTLNAHLQVLNLFAISSFILLLFRFILVSWLLFIDSIDAVFLLGFVFLDKNDLLETHFLVAKITALIKNSR